MLSIWSTIRLRISSCNCTPSHTPWDFITQMHPNMTFPTVTPPEPYVRPDHPPLNPSNNNNDNSSDAANLRDQSFINIIICTSAHFHNNYIFILLISFYHNNFYLYFLLFISFYLIFIYI